MTSEARVLDLNYELGREQQTVKQPLELSVSKKAGISRGMKVQIGFSLLIVSIMAIACIGTNLKLYELTSEISLLNSSYNQLVSENDRATVELESKMSLRNIEDTAVMAMGMGEMESYQVEYVNLVSKDVVVLPPAEETPMLDKINEMLIIFKDYIGL